MNHILKIFSLLMAISAIWFVLFIGFSSSAELCFIALGCYGLVVVGVGSMRFPTCPQEAVLLQKDIAEAKEYLKSKGVNVGSE